MAEAAPRPVFGFFDETIGYGVPMNVTELFGELWVGEDVEVVVADLPELFAVALEVL